MYDRDPRADWTPFWADLCGVQPWQCEDLTPTEHDSIVQFVEHKMKNPTPSLL